MGPSDSSFRRLFFSWTSNSRLSLGLESFQTYWNVTWLCEVLSKFAQKRLLHFLIDNLDMRLQVWQNTNLKIKSYELHESGATLAEELNAALCELEHLHELRSGGVLCHSFSLRDVVLVLVLKWEPCLIYSYKVETPLKLMDSIVSRRWVNSYIKFC